MSEASADELIRAISHDLQTPLGRAVLHLDAAAAALDDDEIARRSVDEAMREIRDIARLVATLVSIERIRASDARHVFYTVRIDLLVEEIAELFAAALEDIGAHLERDADTPVEIVGEETLLRGMLVHLVDNAVRHCPAGGLVRLAARHAEGGPAALLVADSGPGIPPDMHQRVLAPFHRLESSRTSCGHGLGLAYVDAVVQRHGAELRFANADPGLLVTVTFPPS